MHRMIMLGPQGSGKGTQAVRLSQKLNVPALSMGQLLRDEVASGSELGTTIASYIDDGQLVPDDITSAMLQQRLSQPDVAAGFILDGYPRFLEQYEYSKTFLQPTAVLVLDVPEEESVARIMKRAQSEGRVDDTLESLQKRLAWSREKTQPVIERFREEGILHVIDGMGSIEDVEARIDHALGL